MQEPPDEMTPSDGLAESGRLAAFRDAYLRYGPLLQRICVTRFGIPVADADELVQGLFASYLYCADEVESLEGYLIGAICNASNDYLRPGALERALYCGRKPCMAMPDDALLREVERQTLLSLDACRAIPRRS